MSERWRALVVGCGRIGGLLNSGPADAAVFTHALAYHRHPSFDLVACVDPNEKARTTFMARWNVRQGYETLEAALAAEQFDIVSIAGPTSTHLAVLERLADASVRAIFAEKPLGADPRAARRILQVLASRNIPVAVNFQRRWDTEMVRLRDEIASGAWGQLRAVTGRYVRGIVNNGSHWVNLLVFLVGTMPTPVWAGNARYDGVDGDPTCDARLVLPLECPVHLVGSDGRDFSVFEMSLCFSLGEARVEGLGFKVRRLRAELSPVLSGAICLNEGSTTNTAYGEAMLRALDDIIAWRPGTRLASDAESALEGLEVNEMLRTMAHRSEGKDAAA